jgi:hypothetical protein
MPWMSRTIAGLGFGVIAAAIPYLATATTEAAQPPQSAQPPRVDARFSLTAEPFCSEVKVRTSSARLHWSAPAAALAANGLTTLAAARQTLEATIYKNGFEQGLLVAVPIGPATADRPVLPQAQAAGRQQPRAFQIRVVGVEQPRATDAADAGVVVENLEPGVNYTWRIALETRAGRIVSPAARFQAKICPADLETSPRPRRPR